MTTIDPTAQATASPVGSTTPYARRWAALASLAIIQFILVLDTTVVNVALPAIQRDLHFSTSGLAWVVDGYALMAGGLLLLGGRLGDLTGRRRMFLVGVAVFAAASVLSGSAGSGAVLVVGRLAQGLGEAIAAPSALAIVALLFTDPAERTRALGIWGGLAALGGTLGVVTSGVITSELDWRWIFFLNLPFALVTLVLVPRLVPADRPAAGAVRRLDLTGALLSTGGLIGVVAGLLEAGRHPWGDTVVVVPLVAGVVALAAFVVVESRIDAPLVPLGFFTDRTRVSANIAAVLLSSAFFAMFFSATIYMQQVLGYSALRTGLAYLPFGMFLVVGIGTSTALLGRLGTRAVMIAGFTLGGTGLLLLAAAPTTGHYLTDLLPGLLLLALGNGLLFPALQVASLHGVDDSDAGLGSAVQSTIQQVGGALGLAVVVAAGTRHTATLLGQGVAVPDATTSGLMLGLRISAIIMLAGAVLAAAAIRRTTR